MRYVRSRKAIILRMLSSETIFGQGPAFQGNMKDAVCACMLCSLPFPQPQQFLLHHATTILLDECFRFSHNKSISLMLEGMQVSIKLITLLFDTFGMFFTSSLNHTFVFFAL